MTTTPRLANQIFISKLIQIEITYLTYSKEIFAKYILSLEISPENYEKPYTLYLPRDALATGYVLTTVIMKFLYPSVPYLFRPRNVVQNRYQIISINICTAEIAFE